MAYTDFNLEEVLGSEERSRYQTFAEVNHQTLQRSLKDFVINLLKSAYTEIVGNEVSEFGDYQSAKVVGPANKARTAIYKNIPNFYSILGCITPEETADVTVEMYAYAGGKSGLYLGAIIHGLRDVEYKYLYPENIQDESDDPETDTSKIKISMSCIGCSVTEVERYDVLGTAHKIAIENETKFTEDVIIGTHISYHIEPQRGYSVSRIVVDDTSYNDIKKINDVAGITVSEYSLGYEITLTETSQDHNIIFVCEYDQQVISREIEVTAIKCTGVFYDNPRLAPYTVGTDDNTSSTLVIMDGETLKVKFIPNLYTRLAHIYIDGRDYINEYIEGNMFHYDGRTADGNVFDITIADADPTNYKITDGVTITMPVVRMNHTIQIEYAMVEYRVRGFIISPTGETLQKFLDTKMTYDDDFTTVAAHDIIESYNEYQFSRGVVRDPVTNRTLLDKDINVEFYPYNSDLLTINKVTCDADVYLLLENIPQTCVITGEVVRGSVFYSGATDSEHYTNVITTQPIEFGKSAIFRITANPYYIFKNDSPNFGANIIIDGKSPNMAELAENNIELSYIDETSIMIGFLDLNGDHTFRVELTMEKPRFNVSFSGTHTQNGEDTAHLSNTTRYLVNSTDTVAVYYVANEGYLIPIEEDELDLTKCEIFINGITVETASAIPTQYGTAKAFFRLVSGSLYVNVTEVSADTSVVFNLKEEAAIPPEEPEEPDPTTNKYTINVVDINVTVEGSNPVQVDPGSDLDIIIHANQGTTLENIMFILDKHTDHTYRWTIDLDQDSFNIFDKEIEGVPQIDNNGTVVRTRDGNHYDYTVHLKNIRNNYEIRFSTLNIWNDVMTNTELNDLLYDLKNT